MKNKGRFKLGWNLVWIFLGRGLILVLFVLVVFLFGFFFWGVLVIYGFMVLKFLFIRGHESYSEHAWYEWYELEVIKVIIGYELLVF